MYIWIWAVLIVQGSLAVSGSLYMLFVKQKQTVIEVPVEPSVPPKEPQSQQKSRRKKLLF